MVAEIKAMLDATLPHLTTRAALIEIPTGLNGEISGDRSDLMSDTALWRDLAEQPGRSPLWVDLRVRLTAHPCGLAIATR